MTIVDEFLKAKKEFEIAKQDFNYAEERFIDVAIHRYNAAEAMLSTLISLAKEEVDKQYA